MLNDGFGDSYFSTVGASSFFAARNPPSPQPQIFRQRLFFFVLPGMDAGNAQVA